MDVPTDDISGCGNAHGRLRSVAAAVTVADVGRPSALPGWTVGHVLTHLEQNAEAMCRRIEATARGELIEQYAGGAAGRAERISAGAARDVDEIALGVDRWSTRLDELFTSMPVEVWARPVRTVAGGEHPVAHLPFRRWREVEVHLVDLDLGCRPESWPTEFIERALPRLIAGVSTRADQRSLTAWLFGRGPAPELESWA